MVSDMELVGKLVSIVKDLIIHRIKCFLLQP